MTTLEKHRQLALRPKAIALWPEQEETVSKESLEQSIDSLGRTANRIADERNEFKAQRDVLLVAAKGAKKYLEPDLVEPGRTVFWNLVSAIARAEGKSNHAVGTKKRYEKKPKEFFHD